MVITNTKIIHIVTLIVFILSMVLVGAKDDIGKEKRNFCNLERLEREGEKRRAAHLKGHFKIPRYCETLSFYEYWKDERVSRRVRAMPIRELFSYIATALELGGKLLKDLTVLQFGHCGIHDGDIPMFLKIFHVDVDWSRLREIHLNGNRLTDQGVKLLIGSLRSNRGVLSGIRELHLDHNQIGHEGMKVIVEFAKSCRGFKHLYLSHNPAWSASQGGKLGEVLKWMPITQKSNLLDGDFERQQIEVHIGGPTIVKRLIDAAAAPLDNKASNSDGDNMSRRNIPRGALPEGKEWIDRVARMEIALLKKNLHGTQSMLSVEHLAAIRQVQGDKLYSDNAHTKNGAERKETNSWEEQSEGVMSAFVEGCVPDPAVVLGKSAGKSEGMDGYADINSRLLHLGYPTPSMLIAVDPEDLKLHLGQSPDILVKAILRCTCEYYPHFLYLVEVSARATTTDQVTLSDLLDDPRAMHMNMLKGPLFKRTKQSVRYAGNQIHNLGTGAPHKTWLPYRHKDHHLVNTEPSLHERLLSQQAVHRRASRVPDGGSKLDLSGMAGIHDDYRNAWKGNKYITNDVIWHRSYCAAPYFKRARGVGGAVTDGEPRGIVSSSKGRKSRSRRKDRHGRILSGEL